jgi:restriction system protein
MAVWLIRAGAHGEYEEKFITENRVYVTWDDLDVDLSKIEKRDDLTKVMIEKYPDAKPKTIQNWVSQVFPFINLFQKGDLVVLPLKTQPAIQIGEIIGDYHFNHEGPDPYFHWREIKWVGEANPELILVRIYFIP